MRGARDRQHKRRIRGDRENERQRKGYSAKSRKEFKGKLGRGLCRRRFYCPRREGGGGLEGEVGGRGLGGRIGEEGREELRRRTEALSDLVEDPNSSVLGDPAAVAVLRAPTTEPGPSRPTRQVFKCPAEGCPITRMTEAAISVHFENAHE